MYPCAFERQLAQMFCLGGSLNAAEHTENVPSAVALQISPSLLMFWTAARLPLLLALSLRPAWCYSCLSLWNASVLCKCWSSHCVLCVRVRACVSVYCPSKYRVLQDRGSPFSNRAPAFLCAEDAGVPWRSTISSSRCVCVSPCVFTCLPLKLPQEF